MYAVRTFHKSDNGKWDHDSHKEYDSYHDAEIAHSKECERLARTMPAYGEPGDETSITLEEGSTDSMGWNNMVTIKEILISYRAKP